MKRLLLLLAFILPAVGHEPTIDGGGYDPEPVGDF
ncbi:MAG: hypothetical protein JWO82_2822, partial [Akkermansiaceae bacterium]|nr:hypothetical protein [Akkermansiaceae bacterium]